MSCRIRADSCTTRSQRLCMHIQPFMHPSTALEQSMPPLLVSQSVHSAHASCGESRHTHRCQSLVSSSSTTGSPTPAVKRHGTVLFASETSPDTRRHATDLLKGPLALVGSQLTFAGRSFRYDAHPETDTIPANRFG
eukprot:2735781-Amphidinium_carterae.1